MHWQPWDEQTLAAAKAENKLMIISIGYSACHWCHVMEHESFEDEEVARLMNEHFVSIRSTVRNGQTSIRCICQRSS